MTRHNYSRWRRPGNLKAKTSVLKLFFSNINFNCKHYVLWFKVILLFQWRFPLKHEKFLSQGRKPEVTISHAVVSPRFFKVIVFNREKMLSNTNVVVSR